MLPLETVWGRESTDMNVAIIGTGYVGLVTGTCLAALGHNVHCVDSNPERVAALRRGTAPIHENGLGDLVRDAVAAGRLTAGDSVAEAVRGADLSMICVGTPSQGGRIDLSLVNQAAAQIGEALRGRDAYHVVVVKSTVVPGSTDTVIRETIEAASGKALGEFGLCMNPEFLSQGSAVDDFARPDRIVIGQSDDRAGAVAAALYDGFDCPKLHCGLRNAEMIKYAANAFQATMISFSNQIAAICERIPGADEAVVMQGVHLDRNLSPEVEGHRVFAPAVRFLRGGIGFGGSCFPKDLVALRHLARLVGAPSQMLDAVIETNENRAQQVVEMLERDLGGVEGRVVSVLGLAFKPDTDDLRESPGLGLIRRLLDKGAVVRGHDPLPLALHHARDVLDGRVALTGSADEALAGADAAVIATAWPEYKDLDWSRLGASMRQPILLDGRNLLANAVLPPAIQYRRIGVGRIEA